MGVYAWQAGWRWVPGVCVCWGGGPMGYVCAGGSCIRVVCGGGGAGVGGCAGGGAHTGWGAFKGVGHVHAQVCLLVLTPQEDLGSSTPGRSKPGLSPEGWGFCVSVRFLQ